MTLSELLTDLESKTDVVDVNSPQLRDEDENVKKYDVPVILDRGNDLVVGASQPIVVIDEGEATEAAYYNAKKVFNVDVTTFNDEVQARADSFEGTTLNAGTAEEKTIIKVTLQQVFEDRKAATVKAFFDDGSSLNALLYKDNTDAWQEKILT